MARISLPAALIVALALVFSAFGGVTFAQGTSIDVELGDFYIDMPSTIPAGPVTLNVTSVGAMPHTLTIEGNGVSMTMPETLATGGSTTWEIDLEPGTYTFYCPIGNHREAGMELAVTVEEAAQAEPTPTGAQPEPATTEAPEEPTPTEAAAEPTATEARAAAATPTTAAGVSSTVTPLPGMPNTGTGGSQSDGTSTGMLVGLGLLLLAMAGTGSGLLYRSQRNVS